MAGLGATGREREARGVELAPLELRKLGTTVRGRIVGGAAALKGWGRTVMWGRTAKGGRAAGTQGVTRAEEVDGGMLGMGRAAAGKGWGRTGMWGRTARRGRAAGTQGVTRTEEVDGVEVGSSRTQRRLGGKGTMGRRWAGGVEGEVPREASGASRPRRAQSTTSRRRAVASAHGQ